MSTDITSDISFVCYFFASGDASGGNKENGQALLHARSGVESARYSLVMPPACLLAEIRPPEDGRNT